MRPLWFGLASGMVALLVTFVPVAVSQVPLVGLILVPVWLIQIAVTRKVSGLKGGSWGSVVGGGLLGVLAIAQLDERHAPVTAAAFMALMIVAPLGLVVAFVRVPK